MGSSASVWVLNVAIFLGAEISRRHAWGLFGKPKLSRACALRNTDISQRAPVDGFRDRQTMPMAPIGGGSRPYLRAGGCTSSRRPDRLPSY
jgi:hypothetical protein